MELSTPFRDESMWRQLHADFRRLRLMRDADAAFGALAAADEKHAATMAQLKAKAGSDAEATSSRAATESYRCFRAAEEGYWQEFSEPVQAAARRLTLTPAPDVDALEVKVRLIREFELDLDKEMPGDVMSILQQDSERLGSLNCSSVASSGGNAVATGQAAAHLIHADRLAQTIADLICPDRPRPDLNRAITLLNLQQDELRRAAEALGEKL